MAKIEFYVSRAMVESLEGGSTHVRRKASVVESVVEYVPRGADIVKFNGAGS